VFWQTPFTGIRRFLFQDSLLAIPDPGSPVADQKDPKANASGSSHPFNDRTIRLLGSLRCFSLDGGALELRPW
jgi:hypothetical protein